MLQLKTVKAWTDQDASSGGGNGGGNEGDDDENDGGGNFWDAVEDAWDELWDDDDDWDDCSACTIEELEDETEVHVEEL